jgi:hydrogenase maturation protease
LSEPAAPPSPALAHDPARAVQGRVFVGGVGNPWLGDLDFGPQFIHRYHDAGWPDHVEFGDAAVSAHRVLHLLQDVAPSRVIFVAGWVRGDPPGTIRRTTPDLSPPDPDDVAARLGEAAGGIIDFDHTLVVARYYQALPPDTVVIEVEAVEEAFSTAFSPTVEASFEPVRQMVAAEIARPFGTMP